MSHGGPRLRIKKSLKNLFGKEPKSPPGVHRVSGPVFQPPNTQSKRLDSPTTNEPESPKFDPPNVSLWLRSGVKEKKVKVNRDYVTAI